MNYKKKSFTIKSREVNIEDIDLIKIINGGIIIKYSKGNLMFINENIRMSLLNCELLANGYRNFLPIQHCLINTDHLIDVSEIDNEEHKLSLIFDKNEENIELGSQEELFSVARKLNEYTTRTFNL